MKLTQEERKWYRDHYQFSDKKVKDAFDDLAALEAELASARKMMEDCTGDDAYERVNLWLDQHPEPPTT